MQSDLSEQPQAAKSVDLRERPSMLVKVSYGFSGTVDYLIFLSFELFILFYYTQVLGLSGFLAGIAILISMIFDAVSDPLVGSWSDGLRSRFGRRHSLMLLSVIPLALSYYALFSPPTGLTESGLFAWLTVSGVCMRLALTLFSAPASALAAELSPNKGDRAELGIYRQVVSALAQMVLIYVAFSIFFKATPEFANGQENAAAYSPFALSVLVGILACIAIVFMGTFRRVQVLESRLSSERAPRFSLRSAFADWWKVLVGLRNFRAIFFGLLFASTMGSCYRSLNLHLGTYLWTLSPEQIKNWQQLFLIGMFTTAIGARLIINRVEPKHAYLCGYLMLLFGYGLPSTLTVLGVMPPAGAPGLAVALFSFNALAGGGAGLLMVCSLVMFSETTDEYQFLNAVSRTGLIFGLVTFGNKAASGLGKLLSGWSLDLLDFPSPVTAEAMTPALLNNLALTVVGVVFVLGSIGLAFLMTYHLPRERHAQILAGIENGAR